MKHIIEILEKLAEGIDPTTGEVFDTEQYRGNPQIISALQKLQKTFYNRKKESKYQKYEIEFPEHIVVMKEGYFYSSHNKSAVKLADIMGYSVGKDYFGRITTGGPDIDKIRQALNAANYNFIIVEHGDIVYKKDGQNPFIDDEQKEKLGEDSDSELSIVKNVTSILNESSLKIIEYSCNDCMELKRENCFGEKEICEFFRYSPSVAKEEKEKWPKYGDATALKLGERR